MKAITHISRVLVGALFIFSGLIKLNDPMGFSFKLGDYFAADVLNLPFLQPFTLELALFIVTLEVLLGMALLLGFLRKTTLWLLLGMIVFFTFLTFYSAYFNKVTDCGCFGDAIPLTPWQSFYKDLILLVLILILFFNERYIRPLFKPAGSGLIMVLSLLLCILFGYHVLNHLPLRDFRPYAEGMSIVEGMKSAEELGKEPTKYATIYYMKNKETGEEQRITSQEYVDEKWWEREGWKMQEDKTESEMVKKGYEPPIHDFVIFLEGEDRTAQILDTPVQFLVITYNLDKADREAFQRIGQWATTVDEDGYPVLGLTASSDSKVAELRRDFDLKFPVGNMDETVLKTIIRSNPGVMLLRRGRVVKKWHYNDLPQWEKIKERHL